MSEISLADKQTLEEFIKHTINKRRHHLLLLLWGCLFSLIVADGLITKFLIEQRLAWESNPFLADLVGDKWFIAIKAFGAALAIIILWNVSRRHFRIVLVLTCCFVSMYTIIVYWNILVFFMGL